MSVVDWMRSVSAGWEALTPPDRPNVTYHLLDNLETDSWIEADRGFMWAYPVRNGPVSEQADGSTLLVVYDVTAHLFVQYAGRGFFDRMEAAVLEASQLMRYVESQTSYPAGICTAITEEATAAEELTLSETDSEGGVRVELKFRVYAEESQT